MSMVIEGRTGAAARASLERLLRAFGIEIVAVAPAHADIAIKAFCRFGQSRHKAALNMGDCFGYALAKALDMPLLFTGDDFSRTDLKVVD
ncbi:MAG: type II toxin-antitoxin system VapC family toxin [Acetobacteraceae bacterium]|nr:type II toxin-antitoxin system VapC family toxin [Acetobacteraceae bacterium]